MLQNVCLIGIKILKSTKIPIIHGMMESKELSSISYWVSSF